MTYGYPPRDWPPPEGGADGDPSSYRRRRRESEHEEPTRPLAGHPSAYPPPGQPPPGQPPGYAAGQQPGYQHPGYQQQGYQQPGHQPPGYPPPGYHGQGGPPPAYPPQAAPSSPTQGFPTQGYPTQGYPVQGYPQPTDPAQRRFPSPPPPARHLTPPAPPPTAPRSVAPAPRSAPPMPRSAPPGSARRSPNTYPVPPAYPRTPPPVPTSPTIPRSAPPGGLRPPPARPAVPGRPGPGRTPPGRIAPGRTQPGRTGGSRFGPGLVGHVPSFLRHLPHHRPWMVALAAIATVVVLAMCGVGSFFIVSDSEKVVGGLPTPSPTPARRDITDRKVDPKPLTLADVFPTAEITVDPAIPPYKMAGSPAENKDCRAGATNELGKLLVRLGCNQLIRATFKSPDNNYLITAGIFNLSDNAGALQAHAQIRKLIDEGTGRFTGFISGAPGTQAFGRAATQLAWDAQGHFLSYCVIARANGKAFEATDPNPRVIIYDIVENYLREQVLATWSLDTSANASASPTPSPGTSP